jgi:hypothetical protein
MDSPVKPWNDVMKRMESKRRTEQVERYTYCPSKDVGASRQGGAVPENPRRGMSPVWTM